MRVAVFVLPLLLPAVVFPKTATPAAGIPLTVAGRRAATISNVRYALSVSIPEQLSESITGKNTIRFALNDNSAPLIIDFATTRDNVKTVDANGSAAFDFVNGHIVVPAT